MIKNYKEGMDHMFNIGFLNRKGLREYCKILRQDINEMKQEIVDLKLSNKG